MTIEITKPELKALIEQPIMSDAFAVAEVLIFHALRVSPQSQPTALEIVDAQRFEFAASYE